MAGSVTKRLSALLVFSGLVPVSALVAQDKPYCESKVSLPSGGTLNASIVMEGTYESKRFDFELQPKSAKLSGLDWRSDARPRLSIRVQRSRDGDAAKWMSVGFVDVEKDGSLVIPTWKSSFDYNGKGPSTAVSGTTMSFVSGLTNLVSDLDTNIAVNLTGVGQYADSEVSLRYSKSKVISAAKAGAKELDKLEKRKAGDECVSQFIDMSGGMFMPGCFLTSAACDTIGLADDCWELSTLRRFRDEWLAHQPGGADDIATYYAKAPAIAAKLRDDPKALVKLYWKRIVPSALAARIGMKRSARRIYHSMMRDLMTA